MHGRLAVRDARCPGSHSAEIGPAGPGRNIRCPGIVAGPGRRTRCPGSLPHGRRSAEFRIPDSLPHGWNARCPGSHSAETGPAGPGRNIRCPGIVADPGRRICCTGSHSAEIGPGRRTRCPGSLPHGRRSAGFRIPGSSIHPPGNGGGRRLRPGLRTGLLMSILSILPGPPVRFIRRPMLPPIRPRHRHTYRPGHRHRLHRRPVSRPAPRTPPRPGGPLRLFGPEQRLGLPWIVRLPVVQHI